MAINPNKIFYSIDKGASWEGPFSREEMAALSGAGIIPPDALIRREGEDMSPPAPEPAAPPSSPADAAPPPLGAASPPLPSASEEDTRPIRLAIGGQQHGPYTVSAVKGMQKRGEIHPQTMYWMEGMAEWRPLSELLGATAAPPPPPGGDTLPKLQGFNLGVFFSEVFKHHKRTEMDAILCCGTDKTSPPLLSINTSWPSPWLFARFLLLCVISLIAFDWMTGAVGYLAFPGFVFAGTVGLPVCAFLLLFELNVRRDVSLHRAIIAILMGGLVSLVITVILNGLTADVQKALGNDWQAVWAGPVEETAKLLTVILIASGLRNGRILTGIVLGAAVGTGFAVFETAGYLCRELMASNGNLDHVVGVMFIRAIGAWSGHTVNSAIVAGAFWMLYGLMIKEGRRLPNADSLGFSSLTDIRFLRVAAIAVGLHMFHNSPLLHSHYLLSRMAADIIGWFIVLRLVQMGLHQIREEQERQQNQQQ